MKSIEEKIEALEKELSFKFARSGGSGGQHVNKVETKVILQWDYDKSYVLTTDEKYMIQNKLSRFINQDNILQLYHQTDRSQIGNKTKVVLKWKQLLHKAFKKEKTRKATKPPKSSVIKRKKIKNRRSETKKLRQKPRID